MATLQRGTEPLSATFAEYANGRPYLQQAIRIVLENARGGIWLVGGAVYRPLVASIYGVQAGPFDFDFIVEKPWPHIALPSEWAPHLNKYGNPKFVGPRFSIDFVPLGKVSSIVRRGLEPTIENYLAGTPLTVQSLCYDVRERVVLGAVGRQAIESRTVGVNDKEQAAIYATRKQMPLADIIQEKAASLGFTPVLP